MELEKRLYGQEIVCWLCLQIAITDGEDKEKKEAKNGNGCGG